jgi:hypothetical protein
MLNFQVGGEFECLNRERCTWSILKVISKVFSDHRFHRLSKQNVPLLF